MKHFARAMKKKLLKAKAQRIVKNHEPAVIGITGNVGKTSAKETVALLIARERTVRAASRNFNNELGLPLSIIGDFGAPKGILFWIGALIRGLFELVRK